jgi:DNA-binding NtrC family response regulator
MNTLKLLIVDDEKDFVATLIKRIQKRQIDATGVSSGPEALAFLDRESVDVVVLDLQMPGMDGLEALKQIKARFPLVEVIMLTGHCCVDMAIEGMQTGAFDYLVKPMDIDELLFKVQDAFERKSVNVKKDGGVG